jgi:hypothetical protein
MLQFDNPRLRAMEPLVPLKRAGLLNLWGHLMHCIGVTWGERPRETKIEYGPLHHMLHVVSMCCGG